MIKSQLNDTIEWINAALSTVYMLTFCMETYQINDEKPTTNLTIFYLPILFVLSLDWLFGLFISGNRLQYLFSIQSLISYITLIPQSLMVFEVISDWSVIRKYELDFLKVLRIFSLSRLAEVFKRNNKVLRHAVF
jgi:hypothetical protein